MVEISLDIPQDIYDNLKILSGAFSQDVEETVNEVLDAVARTQFNIRWLLESKENEVNPHGLRYLISHRINLGSMAERELFGKILKELNAEGGHFGAGDMTIDLDDNSIWINYNGLIGSNLCVDAFDVTLTGLKRLTADCTIHVDEDNYETSERVQEHAQRIRRTQKELPEEFHNLDPWEVDVLVDDETSFILRAYFSEDFWGYLPPIPSISEFFEKVLASAEVSRSL
ncbi:hypothetical protein ES703_07868 [subsurface metagenome]